MRLLSRPLAPRAAALVVLALAACGREAAPAPRDAVARAARFLWAAQSPDGAWRSEAYGLLRSGQSTTPFVLGVLRRVPPSAHAAPDGGVARAAAFLAAHADAEGGFGRSDPALEDYPTYATGLAASALAGLARDGLVRGAAAWLRSRQLADDAGWSPADAPYGAWGMGGPVRRPPHPGHVDLSMTRHALEGLAAAGARPADPALRQSLVFLGRLQGRDGGFHFSSVVLEANKAGPDGASWRSYGTATADGVLALLAAGVPPDDERVRRALAWLVREHRVDAVPGFPDGEPRRWERAMVGYYRAAAAEAFRRLGVREAPAGRDWRADLEAAVAAEQAEDGSVRNASFLMKEDDPLLATTLALSALLSARGR